MKTEPRELTAARTASRTPGASSSPSIEAATIRGSIPGRMTSVVSRV